jgi:membrane-bound ClpP family serine protease
MKRLTNETWQNGQRVGQHPEGQKMDIFLNPNVAYLTLVAAFLFVFMAIIVPGTGLLEVVSLFLLILAGYAVYNLPINILALGILILSVIPFLMAVRKRGRQQYLLLAIAAMVIGSAFLFKGVGWAPAVNPFLALVVSALSAIFLWIVARKALEASLAPPAHDANALIGQVGSATTDILDEGSVQIGSELWSARSPELIPAGSHVRVINREGLTLLVEKV